MGYLYFYHFTLICLAITSLIIIVKAIRHRKYLLATMVVSMLCGMTWYYYKYYVEEHRAIGTIVEVSWDCWSCNEIIGINEPAENADLDRSASGNGRVAWCFTVGNNSWAHNNVQEVTFHIELSTPWGQRILRYRWTRSNSSTNDFELPMDLPPDGSQLNILTALAGPDAKWIDQPN